MGHPVDVMYLEGFLGDGERLQLGYDLHHDGHVHDLQ